MDKTKRWPAFLAYLLPVIGSIYVLAFQRKNAYAVFHARQSIGLVFFLIGSFLAWAAVGTILAFIPFAAVISVALFTLVITSFFLGIIFWIMGMLNALNGRIVLLPIFGSFANSMPI